ncbi:hypothetical protein DH2020_042311 [Rehmannia glutinosa]|uniref:Uncharacterized protein n=1 Tax=Rehmannia glutinosa TaxID=99300 RepID=A0ABR0UNE2_REHGL
MRELVVLQRSRSLKDPSASPHSWNSPSVVDMLLKRGKRDALVNGRRSVNVERPNERGKMSESAPIGPPVSNGAVAQLSTHNDEAATAVSNRRRVKREKSSRRSLGNDVKSWKNDHIQDGNHLAHHIVSRSSELIDKSVKKKGGYKQDWPLKTVANQLKDIPADSDDVALSCNHDERHAQVEQIAEETEANICSHGNNTNEEKSVNLVVQEEIALL